MAKFSFYVGSDFFETSYEADLTGLGSLSERLRVGCLVGCSGSGKNSQRWRRYYLFFVHVLSSPMSPKTVKVSEVGELLLKGARTDEHRCFL
jgi:hypothetical protein